eukprot:196812-Chlamydomonas_euryale.AAC.1
MLELNAGVERGHRTQVLKAGVERRCQTQVLNAGVKLRCRMIVLNAGVAQCLCETSCDVQCLSGTALPRHAGRPMRCCSKLGDACAV